MKKENKNLNLKSKDSIKLVTESLNKHGEIKGNSKKETKLIRNMCPHHKYNKKGKIKPGVYNDGNGVCVCTLCNSKFPTSVYDDDKLDKATNQFMSMLQQAKYMSVATGCDNETTSYLGQVCVNVQAAKKTYKKIRRIAEKTENIKNKKNKKNNSYSSSDNYGSWR